MKGVQVFIKTMKPGFCNILTDQINNFDFDDAFGILSDIDQAVKCGNLQDIDE